MRPARLHVYQSPRNPGARERQILTLIAEGRSQEQAAAEMRLAHYSVTSSLGRMRALYTAATNQALIALAIRLQWITLAIECTE